VDPGAGGGKRRSGRYSARGLNLAQSHGMDRIEHERRLATGYALLRHSQVTRDQGYRVLAQAQDRLDRFAGLLGPMDRVSLEEAPR
jgi:hypothetical protein